MKKRNKIVIRFKPECSKCEYYCGGCCRRYPPVKGDRVHEFPDISEPGLTWCGEFLLKAEELIDREL